MNFPKFLLIIQVKYKNLFEAEEIKIKVKSLEDLLKYTFDAGYKQGYNEGYEKSDKFHKDLKTMGGNNTNDIFKDMFGGGFGKK